MAAAAEDLKAILSSSTIAPREKRQNMLKNSARTAKPACLLFGAERSYPVLRAFNLDENLFVPSFSLDLETCPRHLTASNTSPPSSSVQMVNTDGWDSEWVEKAINGARRAHHHLAFRVPAANFALLRYTQQRFTDKIGVVFAYQRLSDEDGVPALIARCSTRSSARL
jgi:hypothetical protein